MQGRVAIASATIATNGVKAMSPNTLLAALSASGTVKAIDSVKAEELRGFLAVLAKV